MGSPETVVTHAGTHDLRTPVNLDWVMVEVYALVTTPKVRHPNCRLVLSGVLRHSDESWRRIGDLMIDSTGEQEPLGLRSSIRTAG
jgi:hypothetical protein